MESDTLPHIILRHMRNQNHSLYKRVKRFRSDSEERHLEVLQGMLPGWTALTSPAPR